MNLNHLLDQLFFRFYSYTWGDWLMLFSCIILGLYAILLSRR